MEGFQRHCHVTAYDLHIKPSWGRCTLCNIFNYTCYVEKTVLKSGFVKPSKPIIRGLIACYGATAQVSYSRHGYDNVPFQHDRWEWTAHVSFSTSSSLLRHLIQTEIHSEIWLHCMPWLWLQLIWPKVSRSGRFYHTVTVSTKCQLYMYIYISL